MAAANWLLAQGAPFPRFSFWSPPTAPSFARRQTPTACLSCPSPAAPRSRALSDEEYRRIIASRPDTILLTSAFGLQNTRSPRAVEARAAYARLATKAGAGATLSAEENQAMAQLQLFVTDEE